MPGLDVFGGVGYTNARFGSGSVSGGVDVSGNKLSNAPGFTADAGVQYSRPVSGTVSAYGAGRRRRATAAFNTTMRTRRSRTRTR